MKYLLLVGDGMGDYPIQELRNRTPLEAAHTPAMDYIAQHGELGLVRTIPKGMEPGSDVANLSLLGYAPSEHYTGRGPIEAASLGVKLNPEDVAFRCNLVTLKRQGDHLFMVDYSAGHISTEEGRTLIQDLAEAIPSEKIKLYPGIGYRHLLVWKGGPEGIKTYPPHDFIGRDVSEAWQVYEEEPVLRDFLYQAMAFLERHPINHRRRQEGKPVANSLWPWGQGRAPRLEPFSERYGLRGAIVAAVDLIKGLGICAGLEIINVPGATGYLDTNYRGKAEAALEALHGPYDFVFLHVEAPDEASHEGLLEEKIRAIESFDREVVKVVLEGMADFEAYKIMIATDHLTPISLKTHASVPVPFAIYDSRDPGIKRIQGFNEKAAKEAGVFYQTGEGLMAHFIEKERAKDEA